MPKRKNQGDQHPRSIYFGATYTALLKAAQQLKVSVSELVRACIKYALPVLLKRGKIDE